jgi:hypothetical protein
MDTVWMGIWPGSLDTRVLVIDEGETLLKARLRPAPRQPCALATLCEAVALWCGKKVCVAFAADAPGSWCELKPWRDAFHAFRSGPLYEVEFVSVKSRRVEPDPDLGSFSEMIDLLGAEEMAP